MIKRVIDVNSASALRIENKQLIVEQGVYRVTRIPLEDLGILILQHPAITFTQPVLNECQKNNVAMVLCDERHLPVSVILPLVSGNSLHSKVIRDQIAITKPKSKKAWQQIVRHKIYAQIDLLALEEKPTKALELLARKVKSGDPDNCEAQAAQKYWPLLFGPSFRRDKKADGLNVLLNYGYAVVRAMVARAIVGAGLHPALGIHHQNQFNGLNLADDLMEPFRPWVDKVVLELIRGKHETINPDVKKHLLGLLYTSVIWKKKSLPLMTCSHSLVADFKRMLSGDQTFFEYPRLPGFSRCQ